ncbi:unnamed protein product [Paramecium pentaurelia]|uniref:CRC domain-containing protein n=1 Tax=Paramecium pentaurelia TaxID=43138 RepID=A0A8S1RVZ2_9CILI|nr:unnamed protein product [Paramecium pentaurelia]
MEQFIKDLDSTDKKSPQKLKLVRSSNTYQKQNSSPKQIKEELKKNKIIKKLEFNDEFLIIKQDGIISRSTRQITKNNQINSSYTLGLLNSIELNNKNEIINKLIKTNDHELLQVSRTSNIYCKCRKSKCIQNYCVCSANNQECKSNCECYNCSNKQPKSILPKSTSIEFNGCNCRKQNCSKRYCECQKRRIKCTSKCNCCEECENQEIQLLPFQLDSLS